MRETNWPFVGLVGVVTADTQVLPLSSVTVGVSPAANGYETPRISALPAPVGFGSGR